MAYKVGSGRKKIRNLYSKNILAEDTIMKFI